MRRNTYKQFYVPTIDFLKQNTENQKLILGNSALGFGLRFPPNLVDDVRLGFVSGKRPDLIVVDEEYEQSFKVYQARQPEVYQHINKTLVQDYQQIYSNSAFKVFARR